MNVHDKGGPGSLWIGGCFEAQIMAKTVRMIITIIRSHTTLPHVSHRRGFSTDS
jgi:hypothetical protein